MHAITFRPSTPTQITSGMPTSKPTTSSSTGAQPISTVKASAVKKVTVTCVKGKDIRKITAVKPVCPNGYKKK
jgi:hypothetical protein